MAKVSLTDALKTAQTHASAGRYPQARAIYQAVLKANPGQPAALRGLERLEKQTPRTPADGVLKLYRKGAFSQALDKLKPLLQAQPNDPKLWNLRGGIALAVQDLAAAETAFRKVTELSPGLPDGHNNLGQTLHESGQHAAAQAALETALGLRPDYPEALNNLGNCLMALGRVDQALRSLDRAIALQPAFVPAHYNRANALRKAGHRDKARLGYAQTLALAPNFADAHANLAALLLEDGKGAAAVESYRRAADLQPNSALAQVNLGIALQRMGEPLAAISALEAALRLDPGQSAAASHLIYAHRMMCDWAPLAALADKIPSLGTSGQPVSPFPMLSVEDDPARQRLRAENWAAASFSKSAKPLQPRFADRPERLKIGYFSADFHNHATLYLMSGLLRCHDPARFEIFAYSYGTQAQGDWRDRASADAEHFIDVKGQSDAAILAEARARGLDIAIDLKGYTTDSRSGLFQHRLAPVQINYLGFPGTMGAPFMDYVLADPVVIPAQERAHYAEALIRMPHCYQPNDNQRPIEDTGVTRADEGLPQTGFVFCCFNNSYKIGPQEFAIWMRCLAAVPGSVLWLLQANPWVETNLRAEAAAQGIAPERLVFAQKVPVGQHLARHRLADLFLDTFHYNAHTTASDALWTGLPVVTMPGRQFSARVAASLLHAIDLPELIANSASAYEALILALATQPEHLARVTQKLADQRLTTPLYDTESYTRAFETALDAVHARFRSGEPPADVTVPPPA